MDMASHLMSATVEVEQPLADGRHMVGTGFLISDPAPDGRPRTVLVTANHVLDKMPGRQAHIGYRIQGKDGAWSYDPTPINIRAGGKALWTRNPTSDVAVMEVNAPPEFAKAAIPLAWLADGDIFSRASVGPGDEMMVLGYPQGLSANSAGFPILRSGRIASPIDSVTVSPTFLLDFHVFPGNSGGPVFMTRAIDPTSDPSPNPVVMGMLTQQVELNNERLEIGVVTDAPLIRQTLALLDAPNHQPVTPVALTAEKDAAATTPAVSNQGASAWVGTRVFDGPF